MKNKVVTYLLLLAVVTVWGMIGYRFTGRDKGVPIQKERMKTRDTKRTGDCFLKINYADPFLKENSRMESNAAEKTDKAEIEEVLPPKETIDIRCCGKYRKQKKMYYAVEINGSHHIIQIGDTINGLQFIYNKYDSIYFMKNKYKYSAKIN